MDEHDKRAREVVCEVRGILPPLRSTAQEDREVLAAIASALRSTAAAAVAAERERCVEECAAACESMCGDHLPHECAEAVRALATHGAQEHEDLRAAAVAMLRIVTERGMPTDVECERLRAALSSTPMPAPAQAERVSEGHGRCPSCGSLREHAMTWCHACWFATENAGPCCCGMTNAEWRQAANTNPAALERSRIAARLRARADEEMSKADRVSGTLCFSDAIAHTHAATVLRSEADALEGT